MTPVQGDYGKNESFCAFRAGVTPVTPETPVAIDCPVGGVATDNVH
jgi:hypothetical protein